MSHCKRETLRFFSQSVAWDGRQTNRSDHLFNRKAKTHIFCLTVSCSRTRVGPEASAGRVRGETARTPRRPGSLVRKIERNQVLALARVWRKRINSRSEVRRRGGVKPTEPTEGSWRKATLRAARQMPVPPSSSGSGKMLAVNAHPDVSVCRYLFTHTQSQRSADWGSFHCSVGGGRRRPGPPKFRPQQSARLAWLRRVDQASRGRAIAIENAFLHRKWK